MQCTCILPPNYHFKSRFLYNQEEIKLKKIYLKGVALPYGKTMWCCSALRATRNSTSTVKCKCCNKGYNNGVCIQEKDYCRRKTCLWKKFLLSHFIIFVYKLLLFLCFGQIYVVRVLREGQVEPTFVFRTFDEFQELHNKLGILFPLWKLPGYVPNSLITTTKSNITAPSWVEEEIAWNGDKTAEGQSRPQSWQLRKKTVVSQQGGDPEEHLSLVVCVSYHI